MASSTNRSGISTFRKTGFQVGTALSPVKVLPYYAFERAHIPGNSTYAKRISAQIRSGDVNPVGLIFKPLSVTNYSNLRTWLIRLSKSDLSSTIPPGTYPPTTSRDGRDYLLSSAGTPATINRVEKQEDYHPFVANLDLFLKILLADIWGLDSEKDNYYKLGKASGSNSSTLGEANIYSRGFCSIHLPSIIGHRDYIRVVSPRNFACNIDPETSILLDDQPFEEHNPWFPYIAKPTKLTTTYVVIPLTFSNAAPVPYPTDTDGALRGIYVTCSTDVTCSYDRGLAGQNYFEFVRPSEGNGKTKQFFLPYWTGLILPSSVPIRFSSQDIHNIHILTFIHEFSPDGLFDPASSLEQSKQPSFKPTVSYNPFPFSSDDHKLMLERSEASKLREKIVFKRTIDSQHDLYIGTIPIYKTITNPELRRVILTEMREETEDRSASQSQVGLPNVLWPSSDIPDAQIGVFSHFSFSGDNPSFLNISDLPVKNICKFIEENDLNALRFATGELSSLRIGAGKSFIDSD